MISFKQRWDISILIRTAHGLFVSGEVGIYTGKILLFTIHATWQLVKNITDCYHPLSISKFTRSLQWISPTSGKKQSYHSSCSWYKFRYMNTKNSCRQNLTIIICYWFCFVIFHMSIKHTGYGKWSLRWRSLAISCCKSTKKYSRWSLLRTSIRNLSKGTWTRRRSILFTFHCVLLF